MKYIRLIVPLAIVFLTVIFLGGCKKNDNPTSPTNTTQTAVNTTATQDVAYSVAANVAVDNSGTLDEMSDVLKSASVEGIVNDDIEGMMNFGHSHSTVTKQYDSTTGWWTITVTRIRGTITGKYYTDIERVYQQQYLDKNGQFQKLYIQPSGTTNDTAYTINFRIVSGTGVLITPHDSHQLTGLSGAWTVTNANTRTVTLNTTSPYVRSVADTVMRGGAVRTLNGTLTLNFVNITGPRGSGLNWHRKFSGTITGTYHAVVTFSKGGTYTESTIDRTIDITLGGQTIPIRIKGLHGDEGTVFNLDTETGDISQ
ncbi:MAG: hypothetical protein P4L27_05925 [Ignavibacteriaceae bacterium]|nr:hypothetical protein [Ignavibacteriaceae bacterium]